MTVPKFVAAMKQLGFSDVVEVAVGADVCAIEEARDFVEKVPSRQKFLATSCCPSWRMMARRLFPNESGNISMTYTPMIYTARLVKHTHPGSKVVFIGPCAAKKLEAMQQELRSDVDFVLTYEELMGIFEAKAIGFSQLPDTQELHDASGLGRGFAAAGGVAAVEEVLRRTQPDMEIKIQRADGLRERRRLLTLAKEGKLDGFLLEGMACPGGCVAGAETIIPAEAAKKQLEPAFAAEWDTLEPEEQIVRAIIEGREENHLTQNQLAHATGIHQTNISKLESGTANPSLRTLKRLAAGMGRKLKLEFVPAQPDSNVR